MNLHILEELGCEIGFFRGEVAVFAEIVGEVVQEILPRVPVMNELEVALPQGGLRVVNFDRVMKHQAVDWAVHRPLATAQEDRLPASPSTPLGNGKPGEAKSRTVANRS